jgi:hypothetical protein
MVKQVQVVAILMIVNGALVSIMGLLYAFMGPAMFALMRLGPASKSTNNPPDTMFLTLMSAIYLGLGLLVLTAGILNLVAGIRSLKLRGRTFAIVALFSNLIPIFTCYCLPTSLGLMIYGLIVFFQADVAHAFAMVATGVSPQRFLGGVREEDEDEFDEEIDDRSTPRRQSPPTDKFQRDPNEKFRRPDPEDEEPL